MTRPRGAALIAARLGAMARLIDSQLFSPNSSAGRRLPLSPPGPVAAASGAHGGGAPECALAPALRAEFGDRETRRAAIAREAAELTARRSWCSRSSSAASWAWRRARRRPRSSRWSARGRCWRGSWSCARTPCRRARARGTWRPCTPCTRPGARWPWARGRRTRCRRSPCARPARRRTPRAGAPAPAGPPCRRRARRRCPGSPRRCAGSTALRCGVYDARSTPGALAQQAPSRRQRVSTIVYGREPALRTYNEATQQNLPLRRCSTTICASPLPHKKRRATGCARTGARGLQRNCTSLRSVLISRPYLKHSESAFRCDASPWRRFPAVQCTIACKKPGYHKVPFSSIDSEI